MSKDELRDREFDESWKKILEKFFWPFLDFYFPKIAEQVDRSKGYTFLDQEMEKITRKAETKKRRLDKLAKVFLKDQGEIWLLIHVEVQSYRDRDFAFRMFQYYYRIYELYEKPVASLAILTDTDKNFTPSSFEIWAFGEKFVDFRFKIAKILDWIDKEEELQKDQNPFAVVTLASLKTHEKEDEKRFVSKYELTKMLYERGYNGETVFSLYEFLDGIMVLPGEMEKEYEDKIVQYEKEKQMPYITSAERIGMEKGERIGMEKGELKRSQEIAVEMLKDGMEIEQIVKFTKLSEAEIKKLQEKIE